MIPAILGVLGRVAQFGINQLAINRQNRYNSPAAQVGRLKRAGLNPALIYSNIQPDLQSNPNQYSDSSLSHDVLGMYAQETSQQNANTNEFSAKSNAKKTAEETKALQMANDIQAALKSYIDKYPDSYYLPQVKRALAEYNQIISNTNLSDQQHEINRVNAELAETKFWNDLEISEETKKQIKAQTANLAASTEILKLDKLNYEARFLAQHKPWFVPLLEKLADKLGISLDKVTDALNTIADKAKNKIAKVKYGIDYDDAANMSETEYKLQGNPVLKRSNYNKIASENGYYYIESLPDFYVLEKYPDGTPFYRKLTGNEINQIK